MFLEDDFTKLAENVDFFSLMSYDYSSPSRPGPNSPIDWMERFVLVHAHQDVGPTSWRRRRCFFLLFVGDIGNSPPS